MLSDYEVSFFPLNPVSSDGMITISWTDQVEVSPDTVCGVQTYTVFDGKEVCEIDIENKQIIIKNIFLGQGDGYNDLIKVSFTDVTNPSTN